MHPNIPHKIATGMIALKHIFSITSSQSCCGCFLLFILPPPLTQPYLSRNAYGKRFFTAEFPVNLSSCQGAQCYVEFRHFLNDEPIQLWWIVVKSWRIYHYILRRFQLFLFVKKHFLFLLISSCLLQIRQIFYQLQPVLAVLVNQFVILFHQDSSINHI